MYTACLISIGSDGLRLWLPYVCVTPVVRFTMVIIECLILMSFVLPLMFKRQLKSRANYSKFFPEKTSDSTPMSNSTSDPCDGNLPSISKMPNTCQGHMSHSAKAALDARKRQKAEASFPKREDKGEPSEVPWMRHRLRRCLPFWKTFCKSTLVLNWIATGFDLRWKPETGPPPPGHFHKNHQSAFNNAGFVSTAIHDMLLAGSLVQVAQKPFMVSPLGVVFKHSNGKPRLIFDARVLNSFIIVPSFKYEDLGFIPQLLKPDDYFVTTDYSRGYHHVDLNEDFWKYFGVEWEGNYYVFCSLPFGLASACWAFTKITRELSNKWRLMGRRCSGYLDDCIHADQSCNNLAAFVHTWLIPDTEKCGFLLNFTKCSLDPKTRVAYLGMIIDSILRCYEVPSAKRQIIRSFIKQALDSKAKCSVHLLEVITGNLASMHWAFGPLSRLMTMSIYNDFKHATSSWSQVPLSASSITDLQFWLDGFDNYNGFQPLWAPLGIHRIIFTDAAGQNLRNFGGWAGWMVDPNSGHRLIAKGIWQGDIILDHSTLQELLAVFLTIQSFNTQNELAMKLVHIKTDNQAVSYIINKAGSRDLHVHNICKALLWYCFNNRIYLSASWIPRDLNSFADFYSKNTDSGDWKLNPNIFNYLQGKWGKFDIDLFASYNNHQTDRYYSLYFTPTCEGVNAFSFNWGRQCWCNPPFKMMSQVMAKARACRARLCIICPFTPSAPWWHAISPNGSHLDTCVRDYVLLERAPDMFLAGNMAHQFAGRVPRWNSLALLADFSEHQLRRSALPVPYPL